MEIQTGSLRNFSIGSSRKVHLFMLAACALLLGICAAASFLVPGSEWRPLVAAAAVMIPVSALPAILWHGAKNYEKRNAALTLPWVVLLVILVPWVAVLSGQFRFQLRDAVFLKMDAAMGFSVPAIMAWTAAHRPAGPILDLSYTLLFWLLPAAALLPAILGKRKAAEEFLIANTVAFLASIPLFTLLPAIGPWAGYNFNGSPEQKAVEGAIVALHGGANYVGAAGIVCFPSFHVIWAVLSARALWSIPLLRYLGALVAFLIVVSTVTTGWHYVVDVLAGLLIAALSIAWADFFMRNPANDHAARVSESRPGVA